MRSLVPVSLALVALLAGCALERDPIPTADLEPKVRVVSVAGVGTQVTLVLFRDLLATYRLRPGERLTARAPDGTTVVLAPGVDASAWLRRNAFVGWLPEVGARQDVVVTFERPDLGESLEIVARVPGELNVTRPAAGDARALGEPFTVAWDALSEGQVEFRFEVSACEGLAADEFDDLRTARGFAVLPLADATLGLANLTFDAPDEARRCDAELWAGRVGDGILLDPAFGALRAASRTVRVSRTLPLRFEREGTVPTADLEPKVRVVSVAGVGTEVTVVLYRAGTLAGTYELPIGERLVATPPGGAGVVLTPAEDLSTPTRPDGYRAWLPEVAPGGQVRIALERAGDEAALDTRVRVPPDAPVTAPEAGARRTIGSSFTAEWTPFDTGQVELRFEVAACDGLGDEELADLRVARGYPILPLRAGDAGSATLTFTAPDAATSCAADLWLGRTGEAIDLDPAFRGLRAGSRAVRVASPVPMTFDADR